MMICPTLMSLQDDTAMYTPIVMCSKSCWTDIIKADKEVHRLE